MRRDDGGVDVTEPLLRMLEVALLLEDPEHRADRGFGRRLGEALRDLGDGRFPEPVDGVHDLPLAAAQMARQIRRISHAAKILAGRTSGKKILAPRSVTNSLYR